MMLCLTSFITPWTEGQFSNRNSHTHTTEVRLIIDSSFFESSMVPFSTLLLFPRLFSSSGVSFFRPVSQVCLWLWKMKNDSVTRTLWSVLCVYDTKTVFSFFPFSQAVIWMDVWKEELFFLSMSVCFILLFFISILSLLSDRLNFTRKAIHFLFPSISMGNAHTTYRLTRIRRDE